MRKTPTKTAGQKAFEADRRKFPFYMDGETRRPTWRKLADNMKAAWERAAVEAPALKAEA